MNEQMQRYKDSLKGMSEPVMLSQMTKGENVICKMIYLPGNFQIQRSSADMPAKLRQIRQLLLKINSKNAKQGLDLSGRRLVLLLQQL